MNGRRILIKLIFIFLIINGVLLIFNAQSKKGEYTLSTKQLDYIKQVLQKEGIEVSGYLPATYSPQAIAHLEHSSEDLKYEIEKNFFKTDLAKVKHYSSVFIGDNKSKKQIQDLQDSEEERWQYSSYEDEILGFKGYKIYYEYAQAEDGIPSIKEADEVCRELMHRLSPQTQQEYKLEVTKEEDGLLMTYYPLLEQIPIIDCPMTFKVGKEAVKWAILELGQVTQLEGERQALYPVDRVLFKWMDYFKEQECYHITDVQLVYKGSRQEGDLWERQIVPAYKITMNGLTNHLFVNAYNNELIK